MNIATDLSINQFISGLPKDCVNLDDISKIIGKKLESKRGAWYYYNEIQDFIQKNLNKCDYLLNDFEEIDDHSMWPRDLSESERKLYENQIKSKLKETAEIVSKQAGNIPGELAEILNDIKEKPPVFNWKQYFRRLVGNCISTDVVSAKFAPFPPRSSRMLAFPSLKR